MATVPDEVDRAGRPRRRIVTRRPAATEPLAQRRPGRKHLPHDDRGTGSARPGLDTGRRRVGPQGGRLRHAERAGATVREYVAVHHRLGVGAGTGCSTWPAGPGWRSSWPALRGAACAGIDASPRLIAVARDRNPDADLRVGDMHALPGRRELRRGHQLPRASGAPPRTRSPRSTGCWRRAGGSGSPSGATSRPRPGPGRWPPFRLASAGPRWTTRRPWSRSAGPGPARSCWPGRASSTSSGSTCRSSGSSPTRPAYARALAADRTGLRGHPGRRGGRLPAVAADLAGRGAVRDGLPLRAAIAVVGYLARKPAG